MTRRTTPLALLVSASLATAFLVAGCSSQGSTTAAPTSPASSSTLDPTPDAATSLGSTPPATAPSPSPDQPSRLVLTTMTWRLPTPLAREAVVPQGAGLYLIAGGLISGDASTDQTYVLDTTTGKTMPAPALAVSVHDTAGILLGGSALILGGGNATEQDVVQSGGTQGWNVTAHLPQARSDLTAVAIGHQALVLGGYDATSVAVGDIVASTNGRRWRTIGTLPLPVRYAASAARGHAVWMFGGERGGAMQSAVQRVNVSGKARIVAHLPMPLGHATAMSLGKRILIVGGRLTSSHLTDLMWWFDPATKTFTRAGRLPVPLADSALATDGTTAFLIGGESPLVTDRVIRLVLQ